MLNESWRNRWKDHFCNFLKLKDQNIIGKQCETQPKKHKIMRLILYFDPKIIYTSLNDLKSFKDIILSIYSYGH